MIDPDVKDVLEKKFGARFDVPLKHFTSLRVGGPADALVLPGSVRETADVIHFCRLENLPLTIMGGGTNLLVKDKGVRGVTVVLKKGPLPKVLSASKDGCIVVGVKAGTSLKSMVSFCLKQGISGFNFAVGIPGTVGGAIKGNAGAHNGSIGDRISRVTVADDNGRRLKLDKDALSFEYRRLTIKPEGGASAGHILLEAEFMCEKGDRVALVEEAKFIAAKRNKVQPLGKWSAGSFFKNPTPDTPAGLLIDKAGFKGFGINGAAVSRKHANFLINRGNATAEDFLRLKTKIQENVMQDFGIHLEEEVKIIGE